VTMSTSGHYPTVGDMLFSQQEGFLYQSVSIYPINIFKYTFTSVLL